MKLKGKVSIITGADGGIGRETMIALGMEVSFVIATDVNIESLNETIKDVHKRGIEATTVRLDIANLEDLDFK